MDIWIPGYTRVKLGETGGVYDDTSNPKGCIHTTEGSSLPGAEAAYSPYPPHCGYDPVRRIRHQYVPLNRHSYAFRGDESDDEYVIQVEIVGFAAQTHLWIQRVYNNIAEDVIKPLEDLIGIPRRALTFHGEGEGITLASTKSPIRLSPGALRNYRGWLGHQHIPPPDVHWDPGRFQVQKAFNHLTPKPTKLVTKDMDMIEYIKGNSENKDKDGHAYGDRLFRVDFLNRTSHWVLGKEDKYYDEYLLWKACGNQVKVVAQTTLDSFNKSLSEPQLN